MTLRVAVDFGTSSTCVAVSVFGREPQVVAVDGHPLMSSAVYAAPDGTLFVGQEADRQAAVDPSRYEPHPKRRIDEAELLLGSTVLPVRDVFRAVLNRAVREARRVAGDARVGQLVLTHPADWGGVRTNVLRQAAAGLAPRLHLIPEPTAAAIYYTASFPRTRGGGPGKPWALAVLDLGGGTVDVSVVRAIPPEPARPGRPGVPGFQVLATKGDPTFGGADIDQLLLDHVGSVVSPTDPDAWRALIEGRELPDRRRRRVIHQDVRGAKETLSRHTYTDVPMPPPFPDVHVTRLDLERLIAGPVERATELTVAAIKAAGLTPAQLTGIFLVGGSSRIPLVSQQVHQRTGIVPTTLDQPETVVARGALRAVGGEPDDTGVLAADEMTVQQQRPGVRPPLAMPGRRPVPPPADRPTVPAPRPPAPPVPVARRGGSSRRLAWLGGVLAVVAAAAVVLVVALSGGETPTATDGTPTAGARSGRVIAQYEYQFDLPEGWIQTGGDPATLRTELKPVGRESGPDRVLVQQIRLSFDSTADRSRAVTKLRQDFASAGETYSGFDERATYAGREVIYYRERPQGTTVDWYVLFQGHTQVSVGCQYTDLELVAAACDTVVRSLAIIE
jgi:molecular chaperone DnaK